MSTLKVDTIQKADGTGSLSVPAESGTVVTTASPSLGRRNLIINGAMQIDQRNNGSSVNSANSQVFVTDRWYVIENSSETGTAQQVTDAPDGFTNSLKFTNSSTASTPTYGQLTHRIEGYNVAHLGFGTSAAKTITVSFWVKSSVTGDYSISLRNSASNRSNVSTYTINSASTWEYKTVTFVGDTSGTWLTTNGNGLSLIYRFAGSGGTSTLDSWTATGDAFASGSTNLMGTASATWQITGVQLEVGSVATPFEHRSYGEELALCQRYFERRNYVSDSHVSTTANWNSVSHYGGMQFTQIKRAAPTVSTSSAGHFTLYSGGTAVVCTSLTYTTPTVLGTEINVGCPSLSGSGSWLRCTNNSGYIDVDAEL